MCSDKFIIEQRKKGDSETKQEGCRRWRRNLQSATLTGFYFQVWLVHRKEVALVSAIPACHCQNSRRATEGKCEITGNVIIDMLAFAITGISSTGLSVLLDIQDVLHRWKAENGARKELFERAQSCATTNLDGDTPPIRGAANVIILLVSPPLWFAQLLQLWLTCEQDNKCYYSQQRTMYSFLMLLWIRPLFQRQ